MHRFACGPRSADGRASSLGRAPLPSPEPADLTPSVRGIGRLMIGGRRARGRVSRAGRAPAEQQASLIWSARAAVALLVMSRAVACTAPPRVASDKHSSRCTAACATGTPGLQPSEQPPWPAVLQQARVAISGRSAAPACHLWLKNVPAGRRTSSRTPHRTAAAHAPTGGRASSAV
eukprot:scaffold126661_cov28-Tisochrysis_lutea.AAC.16